MTETNPTTPAQLAAAVEDAILAGAFSSRDLAELISLVGGAGDNLERKARTKKHRRSAELLRTVANSFSGINLKV